ncbi:hypothetical protein MLD38_030879 [Melastoma candidum]|uniref:Uncharacterized protein n=1 Tax=Melastoma candidum TaxID=119954 RepID=A0ACB9MN10_9MYRT|nr:hypothetical protein MLD38_030879 [Melastoma candidum]
MIKAAMVISAQGKPRLARFYEHRTVDEQQDLVRRVFSVLSCRAENVSNFMEADSIFGPDSNLVYKHFSTLYFIFVFNSSENELAMLDVIQVFVETLDKCFKNVCELDIVLNYDKSPKISHYICMKYIRLAHLILNGILYQGQSKVRSLVMETNSAEILRSVEELSKLEAASSAISLVPKPVSSWRSR